MKIKTKYDTFVIGTCIPVSNNLMKFSFDSDSVPSSYLSEFELYNNHDIKFAEYSGYDTVYRETENGFILSNDGSVYVEPEPVPEPNPEPYEPTLEETQEEKVQEMNLAMENAIAYGAEVQLSDGTTERFTLTDRDQLSLIGLQVSASVITKEQEQNPATFPWHPADESVHCKFYSQEDMQKISATGLQYVMYHVTYFRDLRIYIRSLTDKESVNNIFYGVTIPEAYQSEPLKAMIAAQSL